MGKIQTTAFNDNETSAINQQIEMMAQYHIRAALQDFTLDECLQLAVEKGDRKIVREIMPLCKHHMGAYQEVALRLPFGEELGDGVRDYSGNVTIKMMFRPGAPGAFMPPVYCTQDGGVVVQPDVPAHVRDRLVYVVRQVLKIGVDYALVKAVFDRLNKRYAKDREYVRYLFPGILPLLRRCKTDDCKKWALRLVDTRALYRDNAPSREFQRAINFADEAVATGVLIGERASPPRDPKNVRLWFGSQFQIKHPVLPDIFLTPLLSY